MSPLSLHLYYLFKLVSFDVDRVASARASGGGLFLTGLILKYFDLIFKTREDHRYKGRPRGYSTMRGLSIKKWSDFGLSPEV